MAWISCRGALAGLAAVTVARRRAERRDGAPRVVSISPSMTEAVFAIRAGDLLVVARALHGPVLSLPERAP
jgi:hypothetical protein